MKKIYFDMDGTVYGDTSKLEQLFNKLLTEI